MSTKDKLFLKALPLLEKAEPVLTKISKADPEKLHKVVDQLNVILIPVLSAWSVKRAINKLTPYEVTYRDVRRAYTVIGGVAYTVGANYQSGRQVAQAAREAARS